jgi:predicted P-loop ATPase
MPNMLKEIKNDINNRMSEYTDSRQPTADEVRLAWLVGEIEELNRRLEKRTIKSSVSINSYPANYVEEELPQIIVEVRYKKDYDPADEYRKEEALVLATKMKTLINEIL